MEHFIDSVREHPCLWKMDTEEYKNNESKEAAWTNITLECDITDVKEAKCIWKRLRDGHRQALNKKRTGQEANTENRLWKYERQMEFLLPYVTNRHRQRITNAATFLGIVQADTDEIIEITETEGSATLSATNNESQQTSYHILSKKRKIDKNTDYSEQDQKRKDQWSKERDLFKKELPDQDQNIKPKEDNALQKFFDSMYDVTSNLPEYLQIRIQRQLFNSVMEAREEHL